jgi:hypothetical protein
MIVTIATYAPDDAAGLVAENLALLRGANRPGLCASDIESSTGAAEMTTLYRAVYRTDPAIPLRQRVFRFGLGA